MKNWARVWEQGKLSAMDHSAWQCAVNQHGLCGHRPLVASFICPNIITLLSAHQLTMYQQVGSQSQDRSLVADHTVVGTVVPQTHPLEE